MAMMWHDATIKESMGKVAKAGVRAGT